MLAAFADLKPFARTGLFLCVNDVMCGGPSSALNQEGVPVVRGYVQFGSSSDLLQLLV